jgi:hypothetical protein
MSTDRSRQSTRIRLIFTARTCFTSFGIANAIQLNARRVPASTLVRFPFVAPRHTNRESSARTNQSLVVAPLGLAPGADGRVLPLVLRDANVRVGRQAGVYMAAVAHPHKTHKEEAAPSYKK